MTSFVYIKEFETTTGAIAPDSIKLSDPVRVSVEENFFPASASQASFFYSDFLVTDFTEIYVTFINSYCTLQNTLVSFTYTAGNYPMTLADASNVCILMPRANKSGMAIGATINLPYTFTTSEYRGKQKIATVTSNVFPPNTLLGFALISSFYNYIQSDIHDVLETDNINVFHLDPTRNNEADLTKRSHAKGVKIDDKRWFVGFEDIRRDNSECDNDFNDVVFEIETSASNALQVLSGATAPILPSVFVNLSAVDTATFGGAILSAEYTQNVENQHLNTAGVVITGGSRLCFGDTDRVLWSDQVNRWVLRQASTGATVTLADTVRNVPGRTNLGATGSSLRYSSVHGSVFGTVRDATNNNVIAGALVILRDEDKNEIKRVRCNANGNYIATYDRSDYKLTTIQFSRYGFVDLYQTTFTSNVSANMIPVNSNPNFRVVLTWGQLPTDLDSHLKADTAGYHVFYAATSVTRNSTIATLDVDDTSSYGPETMTVVNPTSERYKYYVHNYSKEKSFSASNNAEVRVYQNNTLIQTINIAGALNWENTSASYWHVFDMVGGVFQKVHDFKTSEP